MGVAYARGAAYGWRARIGLLQPGEVSDTNPFEFYMMAPAGVQMVLTSLRLGGMSEANYERAMANLEAPVQRLIPRHPDAIIQTGIPPLVYHGWGIEEQLRKRVAQLTPVPYISDAAACIKAMQALDLSRVVVVSAFDESLAELIGVYLGHAGIEMLGHADVSEVSDVESGALPLEVVYRTARDLFRSHAAQAQGVWITQASVPSAGVIADLEEDLGVPVVTSSQALMWAGLLLADVRDPIQGFGRLFDIRHFDY